MSEERHVSCIESPDSPCTPQTCDTPVCWVCENGSDQWPCPTRRAQDAETAIARVRELHGRHDPNCPYGEDCAGAGLCLACREEYPCATIRALNRERAGR